jgi:hypothetical protein
MLTSPTKILRVIIAFAILGAVSYLALWAITKANSRAAGAL